MTGAQREKKPAEVPEPIQFEQANTYKPKFLSRTRQTAIAGGTWKHGSKFMPLPRRNDSGMVGEILTEREERLIKLVKHRASADNAICVEGASVKETPSTDPKNPHSYQYTVSGGIRALGQLLRSDKMTLYRMLKRLEQKCVVRVLTVGNRKGEASVYVFDHYRAVVDAWKRGGYGDKPENRIGLDPSGKVWYNGREDSKRLLTEQAIADYRIAELFTTPVVPAPGEAAGQPSSSSRPTAPAPKTATPAAEVVDIPAIVNEAIDTYAAETDRTLRLRIHAAARAVATRMNVTLLDEEIARAILDFGHKIRNKRDIASPGAYILTSLPALIEARLESRARYETKEREAKRKSDRATIFSSLGSVARLASKADRDESEELDLSSANMALLHFRRENPELVIECEAQFRLQEKQTDARPATWRPPDPVRDEPAKNPDQCPDCGKFNIGPDGFCRTFTCVQKYSG